MHWERDGDAVILHPAGRIDADVRPPGSKSLTNRYLTCLSLADGAGTLEHAGLCDDTERMLAGLRALGIAGRVATPPPTITVEGCRGNLPADEGTVDAGLAGTAMRFLTALACLGTGRYVLDGAPRMRQRPIGALVDALRNLGAGIGYAGQDGYPPLTVGGRGLPGGHVTFERPPSSQYVSALLMVAPYARRDVYIEINGGLVSRPYVDMTLDVMRELGVEVVDSEDATRFIVPSSQRYRPGTYAVEPDASGATYLWAAAAITGGRVRVDGLTLASRQGDAAFVRILEQMGCGVQEGSDYLEVRGPAAGKLRAIDVDLNTMPDTVQTLAVVALFARGTTRVTNVANLRIKETDRLAALATELTKLGATVDTTADGITITPPDGPLRPATIATYDDHRMAMSFAVAGVVVDGLRIAEADCVSKSFPSFYEVLASLDTDA